MKNHIHPAWFWVPRILGIMFILFISLFALDVFDMGLTFWQAALALLMHLLPSIVITIFLALSWRWEWLGSVGFFVFGLWYISEMRVINITITLMLVGLPLLIGALFLLSWYIRKKAAA